MMINKKIKFYNYYYNIIFHLSNKINLFLIMECSICSLSYNFVDVKPYNLDCGHTYCFNCI